MQADKISKAVGIELHMPRQCGRLTQWPNYQSKTGEEYYIPYMDSIIKSIETWFAPDNKNHCVFSPSCTDLSAGLQQFPRSHGPGKSLAYTIILHYVLI